MKNSTYLIILLAVGLVAVSYKWITGTAVTEKSDDMISGNPAIENIMTRTSVRTYSDREVSEAQIDTMLRAAMAAPTAVNKQPWRIVVIKDQTIRDSISRNMNSMKMAKNASVCIVMCGDLTAAFEKEPEFWVQDVSAATENLLLAANAMGLGAVWAGIHPTEDRVKWFRNALDLPEEIIPLACVSIGYPASPVTPKDKWHPEYIHYNSWGMTSPDKN